MVPGMFLYSDEKSQKKEKDEYDPDQDLADVLGIALHGALCPGSGRFFLRPNSGFFQRREAAFGVFRVVFPVDKGAFVVLLVDAVGIDDVAVCVDAPGAGRLIESSAAGAESVFIVIVCFFAFVATDFGHKKASFLWIQHTIRPCA